MLFLLCVCFVFTSAINNGFSRVMDVLQTYLVAALYWNLLALCHGVRTLECPSELPW